MKLIIDIPNSLYANLAKIRNGSIANKRILDSVKSGIPFDSVIEGERKKYNDIALDLLGEVEYYEKAIEDIKAEIAEEICLTDNPYTKETKYTIEYSKLLDILNNISNAESETN